MSDTPLSPPPVHAPFDQNGQIDSEWAAWFDLVRKQINDQKKLISTISNTESNTESNNDD